MANSLAAVEMLDVLLTTARRPIFKLILVMYFLIELLPNDVINWAAEAFTSGESKQFINGKVLRVLVFHYPPTMIITKEANGTINYRGAGFDILNYFAKALNISYEYVHLNSDDIKRYGNGPAQINAIINDEADLAPCGVISSHSKYQQVDLTVPFLMETIELVVPWPEEQDHNLIAAIRPFQPIVWVFLGVSLVVMAFTLTFITAFYRKYMENQPNNEPTMTQPTSRLLNIDSLGRNFIFVWSHLTNRFYFIRLNSRNALMIVVGVWCLMTVVLTNSYAGYLLSFMSVNKLGPVINSLDELALSKETQLVVQGGTDITNQFLDPNATGTYKLLGDSLRKNPENLIYNLNQDILKEKMMSGSYAIVHVRVVTHGIIASTYHENGKKCRLTIAKEPVDSFVPIVQMLRKNSPYTQAINQQIQHLFDTGLIKHFYSKYMPEIDQCLIENQKPDAQFHRLALQNMSFAFAILGLGIGLASLSLTIEFIFKWLMKRNKKQVNKVDSKKIETVYKPAAEGSSVEQLRQVEVKENGHHNFIDSKNRKPRIKKQPAVIKETLVIVDIEDESSPIEKKSIEEFPTQLKANATNQPDVTKDNHRRNVIVDSKKKQNLDKPLAVGTLLVVVDIEESQPEEAMENQPIEAKVVTLTKATTNIQPNISKGSNHRRNVIVDSKKTKNLDEPVVVDIEAEPSTSKNTRIEQVAEHQVSGANAKKIEDDGQRLIRQPIIGEEIIELKQSNEQVTKKNVHTAKIPIENAEQQHNAEDIEPIIKENTSPLQLNGMDAAAKIQLKNNQRVEESQVGE